GPHTVSETVGHVPHRRIRAPRRRPGSLRQPARAHVDLRPDGSLFRATRDQRRILSLPSVLLRELPAERAPRYAARHRLLTRRLQDRADGRPADVARSLQTSRLGRAPLALGGRARVLLLDPFVSRVV